MSDYYANKRYQDRRLFAREIIKSCLSIYTMIVRLFEDSDYRNVSKNEGSFYRGNELNACRTLSFFSFSLPPFQFQRRFTIHLEMGSYLVRIGRILVFLYS